MGRYDNRQSAARRGYDYEWRTYIQPAQLAREPLCRFCKQKGRIVAATVVDHIDGNSWNRKPENLRSLCKACHDGRTARDQGFARSASFYPKGLPRSSRPCTVVCGPPASGKTRFVQENKGQEDTVIDLDLVSEAINGKPLWAIREDAIPRVVIARNELIKAAQNMDKGRVWLVETGPEMWKRNHWNSVFSVDSIVVIETPPEICRARIIATPARAARPGATDAPEDWWSRYTVDYTNRRIV